MLLAAIDLPESSATVALLGGIVLLYASARALADAFVGTRTAVPGLRALAQWTPIVIATLIAAIMQRFDIAIGVIFATSVAALSLGIGVGAYLAPPGVVAPAWRRVWPFALPAGVLALLAGFSAHFKVIHAGMFLVQGIGVLYVYRDRTGMSASEGGGGQGVPRSGKWRAVQMILGIAVAIIGGYLATRGTIAAGAQIHQLSGGVVAAVLLGPGLILSMLGSGTNLAAEGRTGEAITMNTCLALLNLCALLPVVILLGYILPGARDYLASIRHMGANSASLVEAIAAKAEPIFFPMRVWRVDTVAMIVLALVLVPPAAGMWPLGKREGMALIIGYIAYLMLVTGFAARSY